MRERPAVFETKLPILIILVFGLTCLNQSCGTVGRDVVDIGLQEGLNVPLYSICFHLHQSLSCKMTIKLCTTLIESKATVVGVTNRIIMGNY